MAPFTVTFGPPSHQSEEEGPIYMVKLSWLSHTRSKHAILNDISSLFSTPTRDGNEALFSSWRQSVALRSGPQSGFVLERLVGIYVCDAVQMVEMIDGPVCIWKSCLASPHLTQRRSFSNFSADSE